MDFVEDGLLDLDYIAGDANNVALFSDPDEKFLEIKNPSGNEDFENITILTVDEDINELPPLPNIQNVNSENASENLIQDFGQGIDENLENIDPLDVSQNEKVNNHKQIKTENNSGHVVKVEDYECLIPKNIIETKKVDFPTKNSTPNVAKNNQKKSEKRKIINNSEISNNQHSRKIRKLDKQQIGKKHV